MDLGHWEYPCTFDPAEWFGFIYRVIDNTTGQHYIGKKQFWSTKRKVVKNRKNRKVIKQESDWRSYTSSSEHLNKAIEEKGKECFTFLIESLHKSKASLHYAEVECQINEDVLRAKLPNGTKKFYNKMIANMRFVPPDETLDERAHKISSVEKNKSLNPDNLFVKEAIAEERDLLWKKFTSGKC